MSLVRTAKNGSRKVLGDEGYHAILEALFRVVKIERSSTKPSPQLSLCAEIVRIAVETCVKKLRAKTVKAIVGHVTQTLPRSDGTYCGPLVKDYIKALKAILEYAPHAEHFSRAEWYELVDFSHETLQDLNDFSNVTQRSSGLSHGSSIRDSWRGGPSRSSTPGVDISYRNRSSHVSSQSGMSELRESAEDLVLCLDHLISVPHAPILDRASVVLTTLLILLNSSFSTSNTQQATFECVNTIISSIRIDDISLALQTFRHLLPIMQRLWNVKTSAMKDHMLKLMMYGEVYFMRLISSDTEGDSRSHLEDLLEVLQQDYCKRPERDQLQLEDLILAKTSFVGKRPSSTKVFGLRPDVTKAEKSWYLLSIYASLVIALDSDLKTCDKVVEVDEIDNRPKRRKLTKHLDDIFQSTKSADMTQRLFALLILIFVFEKFPLEVDDDLDWNWEVLLPCLSDDSGVVASWAMLTLTRSADHHMKLIIKTNSHHLKRCQSMSCKLISSARVLAPNVAIGRQICHIVNNVQGCLPAYGGPAQSRTRPVQRCH